MEYTRWIRMDTEWHHQQQRGSVIDMMEVRFTPENGLIEISGRSDLGSVMNLRLQVPESSWRRLRDRLNEVYGDHESSAVTDQDRSSDHYSPHDGERYTSRIDPSGGSVGRPWMRDHNDWRSIMFGELHDGDTVEAFRADGSSIHGPVRFDSDTRSWIMHTDSDGYVDVISRSADGSMSTVRQPYVTASAWTRRSADQLRSERSSVEAITRESMAYACPICGASPRVHGDRFGCDRCNISVDTDITDAESVPKETAWNRRVEDIRSLLSIIDDTRRVRESLL